MKVVLDCLNTKIGQRFLAIFLAISLLPLAVMGWFAIRSSERALQRQTSTVLRAASDSAEAQLREFLANLKQELLEFSRDDRLINEMEQVAEAATGAQGGAARTNLAAVASREQRRIPDVQEVFLLTPQGRWAASSANGDAGKDLGAAEYYLRGREGFYPGDVFLEPQNGKQTWIMAAPVRSGGDRLAGVVAFRIDPRTLNDLTSGRRVLAEGADTQSFRIGETGETYIVNRAGFMITESRYLSNAVLRVKVDTLPVRVARERGQEFSGNYRDYRGIEVSGASMILREPGWVVLTEIDFTQAFAPVRALRNGLLELTLALGALVVFLAWSSTRRIIRPLQMLGESDAALAIGDEAAALVPEARLPDDEIGALVRRRNLRIKALFDHERELVARTARLKETVAELEHMSYSMIHDLRAPLRAIVGFAEMILERDTVNLSPESREYLGRMTAAAQRMDHLICDVLNYSVIVKSELPLRRVDLSGLLRGIVQTYPGLQPPRAEISIPPDLPPVEGNEAALTQCFSNLLDNAVKFVQPGHMPHVDIKAERINDWVRISVEDNGIGVPRSFQDKIFGLFQRGATSYEGTGMGLAIVRKAAERMGGRVGLASQPQHGSRFWIELRPAGVQSDLAASQTAANLLMRNRGLS